MSTVLQHIFYCLPLVNKQKYSNLQLTSRIVSNARFQFKINKKYV